MARSSPKRAGPGSIAETVAMLAISARHERRRFAHVEYHSEYARAEVDRRLGEALAREQVPYHHVELPVRVDPRQAAGYLLERLEAIESGAVSITGLATAVTEEDRVDFLGILAGKRETLADFGLYQIWWMTPDFRDAFLHIVPALDSWFMVRLKVEEEFPPPAGEAHATEPLRPAGSKYRIEDSLRRAASLVERFERAKDGKTPESELVALAASAADAIAEVGAPNLTRGLADRLVSGLTAASRKPLVDCFSTIRDLARFMVLLVTQGRGEEAGPLIDRLQARVEQGERPDHLGIVRNLLNIAEAYRETDRRVAEAWYRRALAAAEQVHGPGHPDVARCLGGLAGMLGEAGRLKEAEALARRALAIDQDSLGPDHPDVAADLVNLATVLRIAGRLDEAEPLLRRALAIDERWLGPDDPGAAGDLNGLAALLRAMNRPDEAESLLLRALAIDERSLGADHPVVTSDLVNLAALLQDVGQVNEAEPLLRRALAIDERVYGPGHPSTARDRHRLAALLRARNRPDEAEALLR